MLITKLRSRRSLIGLLWFTAGGILLAAAVLSFMTERSQLIAISPLLGAAMFISGVADILTYFLRRKYVRSVDWVLANGLTSTLMSLYLMFNQVKTVELVLFLFGLWELISGILKAVDCIELKRDSVTGWYLFALAAAIKVVSGAISLMKPVDDRVEPNVLIGVIIFIQAAVFIIKIAVFPHLIAHNKVYIEQNDIKKEISKI